MLLINAQALLRITVALGIAGGLAGANDDHFEDAGTPKQACADLAPGRELEDALSNVRATSNDGFDPVCGLVL